MVLLFFVPLRGERRERRRVEALRAWAHTNGWRLVDAKRAQWVSRMPGRARPGVGLAMTGVQQGHQVSVAEYRTRWDNSTSSPTDDFIAVVVHLDRPGANIGVYPREVGGRSWAAPSSATAGRHWATNGSTGSGG